MAKLPDINYRRAVPTLASGKMAKLPNQLRGINAGVQAARRGASSLNNLMESEAKLDANRRLQSASRDFVSRQADLVQEYHSTDKPLSQFTADMDALREDAFNKARAGSSGTAQKYMDPQLDTMRTHAAAYNTKTLTDLTDSRIKLQLGLSTRDDLAMLADRPDAIGGILENSEARIRASGMSTVDQEALIVQESSAYLTESVNGLLADGDVAGALALQDTAAWDKLPQRDRYTLEAAIQTVGATSIDAALTTTANDLLISGGTPADLQGEMDKAEGLVTDMTGLEGVAAEALTREAQGNLAFRYFQGQLLNDNTNLVESELKSGKYSSVLSNDQTKQLLAGLSGGTGAGLYANEQRAGYKYTVDQAVTGLTDAPRLLNTEGSLDKAELALDAWEDSYRRVGKQPPDSFYTKKRDYDTAKEAAHRKLAVYANPGVAVQIIATADRNTPEGENQAKEATENLNARTDALAVDSIQFSRDMGFDIPSLPPLGSENHAAALEQRFVTHEYLGEFHGKDQAGPLSASEVDDLSSKLQQANDAGALIQLANYFNTAVGEDRSIQIWDQLEMNEDLGVMPVAGRLAAQGSDDVALNILQGQQWRDDPAGHMKPADMTQVREEIQMELKGAFGYGVDQYNRNVDAIIAHYTYSKGDPSSRGDFSYDKDAVQNSVRAVVGQPLEVGGMSYVPPRKGVGADQFTAWMRSLTPERLPAMADASGARVDMDDVSDHFEDGRFFTSDRYRLVEAGPPGKYYVQDMRSRTSGQGGSVQAPQGGLMFDYDRPGQLATVVWDGVTPSVGSTRTSSYRNY